MAPRRVLFDEANLNQLIRATHIRMSDIAPDYVGDLTVAGQRGHREQRSLNVAIHAIGPPRGWGGLATVAAYPIGDPGQMSVRIVARRDIRPDELCGYVFGAEPDRTDLHGGRSGEVLASLLGHELDEIALHWA
jgi:hypothetical protein